MHLGCVDTAYGYGMCNNHVAYITRSSWDISIHLKTAIYYILYINTYCILVARLLYTTRSETTSSLSTHITCCCSCTRSNNEDHVYYLLKKFWNSKLSPCKACWELLFPIVLYFWKLNHFFFKLPFLFLNDERTLLQSI